MKKFFVKCSLCICLCILWGEHTNGQSPLRLGITTGAHFANQSFSRALYLGDNPQNYRTGVIVGGIAEVGITDIWSIYAEPRYIQKGTEFQNITITNNNDPTPSGTTKATFKLDYFELPILLKAKLDSRGVKPFFLIGPAFGINNLARVDAPGTHVFGRPGSSSLDIKNDVNSIDISVDIGAGLEIPTDSRFSLLFDVRYSHGLNDVYSNSAVPSVKSYGFSILGGLVFDIFPSSPEVVKIAAEPFRDPYKIDTDGDGLPDSAEIKTYRTNPYEVDTDFDGLTDGDEVLKYHTDPLNKDTDGDGLTDGDEVHKYHTDPLKKDTDGGGVDDGTEVARGTNPLDPSDDIPKKEEFKIDVGKSVILEGVVFKTGSAEITPASAAILEKTFNTLQQNQEFLVEIQGHTDNVGKRAYNMKLSLARANAVKEYLKQRGIAESRVTTKGFGFDKPVTTNDTPEGRQKNRRIEFFRVR